MGAARGPITRMRLEGGCRFGPGQLHACAVPCGRCCPAGEGGRAKAILVGPGW